MKRKIIRNFLQGSYSTQVSQFKTLRLHALPGSCTLSFTTYLWFSQIPVLLCVTKLFMKRQNTLFYSSQIGNPHRPKYRYHYTTKVSAGEPMSFIRASYSKRKDLKTTASPRLTTSQMTDYMIWEAWSILYSFQAVYQVSVS